MDPAAPHPTARQRLLHELKAYAVLSVYLYVCLGAIQLYKVAVLVEHSIAYAPYGFAAVKALVLAKFMMLGEVAVGGERRGTEPLLRAVLRSSAIFLLILVGLSAVEELIAGAIHGRGPAVVLAELTGGGRWREVAASCLLLWLILLPYLGFKALAEALGADRMRELLLGRR
jgi:hypothetical protein